jgi:Tol biopolymer transport system component
MGCRGGRTVARVCGVVVALGFLAPAAAVASSSVIVYDCAPNLCRIAPDGTGMTQLTSDGQSGTSMAYGGPSLSRDGSKLAFAFNNHIFVSDANANNRSAPFATTGLSALMRPDGGQVAEFEQTLANPPIQLCTYNLDGSGRNCQYATPSAGWAPDNNLLISTQPGLASNEQICHVSAAVNDNQPCSDVRADDPANDLFDPAVSPDGSTLAVTVTDGIGGSVTGHIALYQYATGQFERNLTSGTNDDHPAWSPDGSQITFDRGPSIFVTNASGAPGSEHQLVAQGNSPTWGSSTTAPPPPPPPPPPPSGRVTSSHASLSGVGKRRAKLGFTLTVGRNAAAIKVITIGLPKGLGFSTSKKNLAKAINVKSAGARKLKFTAEAGHGKLTITLKTAASNARVTISSPAISVSGALAGSVKHHKVKTLQVTLSAADTGHRTTRLTLKLRPA